MLFDIRGALVLHTSGDRIMQIRTSGFMNGKYFLLLSDESNHVYQTLIIAK
jgi:hypothetical protein